MRGSIYKPQLEAYLRRLPRENVKIVVFERFVQELRATLDDLCRFLALHRSVDLSGVDTHRNRGQRPRVLRLRLLQNRLLRYVTSSRPLPSRPPRLPQPGSRRIVAALDRALRWANTTPRKYPDMRPETRAHLQRLLARENAGLGDLIGIDLRSYWPYF
ncbi:MAG TPA: hypothetical protein VJX23_15930 [Candidatus Binataceae bacterium]|nr:hypothetical protein [Candidatus Binataceae bacterium]